MLSLLRLECKQKIIQMHFEFAYFSFSYFIWSRNDEYVHTLRRSLENHTRFQTKLGLPGFRPKRRKNPTRWGGTYLCSLYKGVPTSAGSRGKGKPCLTTVKIWFCLENFSAKLHLPINWSVCIKDQNTVMLNKRTSNHQVTFVTHKHFAVLFFRAKVLLKRFHLNGHTIGFHSQFQNLE